MQTTCHSSQSGSSRSHFSQTGRMAMNNVTTSSVSADARIRSEHSVRLSAFRKVLIAVMMTAFSIVGVERAPQDAPQITTVDSPQTLNGGTGMTSAYSPSHL